MGKIRLLIVGISWPPETFIYRFIEGLVRAGVEVTVATAQMPGSRDGLKVKWLFTPLWDGSPFTRLMRLVWMGFKGILRSPSDIRLIARQLQALPKFQPLLPTARSSTRHNSSLITRNSPLINTERLREWYRFLPFVGQRWDVIYFPWNSAAIEHLLLFDWGCPVVVSCRGSQVNVAPHNPKRYSIREGLKITFQKAAAVHCVSEDIKREAIRYGLDPAKAWVIRPAVDPNFFFPAQNQQSRKGVFRIVTIGSLIWRKGYEYALLAVRQLVDVGVPVQFDIIGDGPERQRVLYTVYDLGLQDHVRLLGRLPPEQVRDRLQQADVFLLSSLSEGISNAVLEAMACGLPVVTTDCGGMTEAVTDGVEGFVVPVRDPEAMAEALLKLWKDPELRKRMGKAARERVLREFSLDQQISAFLSLFKSVIQADTVGHLKAGDW